MADITHVREAVRKASLASRKPHDVTLMAVSKMHPYEEVLDAYSQGQRLFGENRVQEIESKYPPLDQRPDGMVLCLIGHLQRNKVKKAVRLVNRIDSVDSILLMDELEKELSSSASTMDILFEVNSSGEEQKSGFKTEAELMDAVAHLASCPHLRLCGLMTVGPLGDDEEKNRKAFSYVRRLYDRLNESGLNLDVLSMGMSGDYIQAIDEGSNEVRIGTAIFGQRNYNA